MGLRRKAREYALQALYLADITKLDQALIFKSVTILHKHEKPMMEFTERLFTKTREHIMDIDEKIKIIADNWEISRMAVLDRNIIRMAAYEIIYELDTPVSVIINEAVELAKAFSTDESGKFVNGILDKLKKERQSVDHGNKKNIA